MATRPVSVLSLDASTYVGHAFFSAPDAVPVCGTWRAPKAWSDEDYGRRFAAFHNWLCDMLTTYQPTILAWETPILPRAGMKDLRVTEGTLRTLIGLVSVAELIGNLRQIRCLEAHVATCKKRLTGDARADKNAMIVAATALGFPVADSHQADATAVALVVYDMLADA